MSDQEYKLIFPGVIPATQEAFKGGESVDPVIRRKERKCVTSFKETVSTYINYDKPSNLFPTDSHLYVAIIQFYTSEKKDYKRRDVDNMAKTVLDVLNQGGLYKDDSQVRTLLVSKIVDLKKINQNLGFIYIKILNDGEDMIFAKDLIGQAVELYGDLKERNVQIKE